MRAITQRRVQLGECDCSMGFRHESRREPQFGAHSLDRFANDKNVMGAPVEDNVAGGGLLDIGAEGRTVHCAVDGIGISTSVTT